MLMTEKQAAEFLCLSMLTMRTYRSRGIGPKFIKLGGGSVRYTEKDLEAYIDAHRVDPAQQRAADESRGEAA